MATLVDKGLRLISSCSEFEPFTSKHVSSANNLGSLSSELCRSLMYIRKNIGPSDNPWGTEMGGVKKHRLRICSESEDLDSDSYPKPVCQQIFESESAPTSK